MLLDMKYDIFSGFILGIFAKIYGIPVKCISNIAQSDHTDYVVNLCVSETSVFSSKMTAHW